MKRIALLGVLAGVLAVLFPTRLALLGALELGLRPHKVYHMPNGNDRGYWAYQELRSTLKALGWSVELTTLPEKWYGISCFTPAIMGPCARVEEERVILVNEALGWDARYETLAHEAGHTQQPSLELSKGQEEQFAEAVSALVTGEYLEHAHYLANYKADVLTLLVLQYDIYEAVRRLTP